MNSQANSQIIEGPYDLSGLGVFTIKVRKEKEKDFYFGYLDNTGEFSFKYQSKEEARLNVWSEVKRKAKARLIRSNISNTQRSNLQRILSSESLDNYIHTPINHGGQK